MKGPGSGEVGLAKQFLTRYAWHRLELMPDTVAWADDPPTQDDLRPYAAGIGMELRIVYVPQARAIAAKQLAARTDYAGCVPGRQDLYVARGNDQTAGFLLLRANSCRAAVDYLSRPNCKLTS